MLRTQKMQKILHSMSDLSHGFPRSRIRGICSCLSGATYHHCHRQNSNLRNRGSWLSTRLLICCLQKLLVLNQTLQSSNRLLRAEEKGGVFLSNYTYYSARYFSREFQNHFLDERCTVNFHSPTRYLHVAPG